MKTPPPSASPRPAREASKLRILQELDTARTWRSLDDERICLLCGQEFHGRDIRLNTEDDSIRCECPTPECPGELRHFVVAGNPLLDDEVWSDWMMALEDEKEAGDGAA